MAFATAADAQVRATISVNGGVQTAGTTTESQSFIVQKNLEDAPIAAALGLGRATLADIGVTMARTRSRVGANISVSWTSRRFGGDVSAQIPHPFFFNTSRPVSGTAPQMLSRELTVHAGVTYQIRTSRRFDLVGFVGPSLFRVTQDLVTDVVYTDTYPYDTATFGSAPTTRTSANAVGFNVGADAAWKVSRRVGLGVLVRYAHGSATLSPAQDNNMDVTLGGLQIGGGLRFLF